MRKYLNGKELFLSSKYMATLTLHNGDCLEVMKEIPDKSISLIICDLPYGCLGPNKAGGGVITEMQNTGGALGGCPWDVKIDLAKFWIEIKRILKNIHCPVIHFCTTKFGNELINSNPTWFRYDLVWDKQYGVSFLSANKMPMRSHEMIYVFSKAGAYYNRVDIKGDFKPYIRDNGESRQYGQDKRKPVTEKQGDGTRCVLSVIQNPKSNTRDGHPTQKPVELYKWLIERYSKPGDTILDPTFGSGNSVFTAFEMGRSAIGIEKDEKFYKKAADKLEAS